MSERATWRAPSELPWDGDDCVPHGERIIGLMRMGFNMSPPQLILCVLEHEGEGWESQGTGGYLEDMLCWAYEEDVLEELGAEGLEAAFSALKPKKKSKS